jgi:thiol-disulfide isomerase/thioredoxin
MNEMSRSVRFLIVGLASAFSLESAASMPNTQLDAQNFCSDPIQTLRTASRHNNKPILLYFTADWCAPCQISKRTLTQNPQLLDEVNLVYVDITRPENAQHCAPLIKRWGGQGIPLFIGGSLENFQHLDRESKSLSSRLDPLDDSLFASYLKQLKEVVIPETGITYHPKRLGNASDLSNLTQSIRQKALTEGLKSH